MIYPRGSHTASVLIDGKVLVAGGYFNTAELYDPSRGTWTITSNMISTRLYELAASVLKSGNVLVTGGFINGFFSTSPINNAELYDPSAGTWTTTTNMNNARAAHTASVLKNGKVLITGGWNNDNGYLNSAELYELS